MNPSFLSEMGAAGGLFAYFFDCRKK